MIDQVKQLLREGNLSDAQQVLHRHVHSDQFMPNMVKCIVADHEFWYDAAQQYTVAFTTEPDATSPAFTSTFTVDYFLTYINTDEDLRGHFFHVGTHERCQWMWRKCPVIISLFNEHYLDVIEDVYGQRLLSVVAPGQYGGVKQRIVNCLASRGQTLTPLREEINTLMTQEPSTTFPIFNAIHAWLYAANPLEQTTFDTYIKVWLCAVSNDEVQYALTEYTVIR